MILEQSVSGNPVRYNERIASYCTSLGLLYSRQKRYEEAEAYHVRAMTTYAQLTQDDPDRFARSLALACNNAALAFHINKKYAESEECFKTAIQLREDLAEDDPEHFNKLLSLSYSGLARLYATTGRPDEAEVYRNKVKSLQTPENNKEEQNTIQEN